MTRPAPSRPVSAVTYAFPAAIRCSDLRPLCLSPGPRAPAAKRDGAQVDSCGLVEAQPRRALLWAAAPPPGSAVRRAVDGAGWLGDGEPGLGSRREP